MNEINKSIYLKYLRIGAFKPFNFGTPMDLCFPDGPSAVVLCGHNGLGKTSVIEALQWALSGTTSRLQGNDANNYVAHRPINGDPVPAKVSVTYSDGNEQLLTLGRGFNQDPTPENVFGLLADERQLRSEIDGAELLRRLEMTHFLSQRSSARFAELENSNLYKRLFAMAGLDMYDHLREIIKGAGNTRRGRAFEDEISRNGVRIRYLDDALKNYLLVQQEITTGDALTPERAGEQARFQFEKITRRIDDGILADIEPHNFSAASRNSGTRSEFSQMFDQTLQTLNEWSDGINNKLARLGSIADERGKINKELSDTEFENLPKPQDILDVLSKHQSIIDTLLNRKEIHERLVELLGRTQRNASDLEALSRRIDEELKPRALEAEKRVNTARDAKKESSDLEDAITKSDANINASRLAIEKLATITAIKAEIETRKSELSKYDTLESLDNRLAVAQKAFLSAERIKGQCQISYDIARESLDQLKKAVGDILGNLEENAGADCPFCGHVHESAEQMRQHAEELLRNDDAQLVPMLAALRNADEMLKDAEIALQGIKGQRDDVIRFNAQIAELSQSHDELKREVNSIAAELGLGTIEFTAFESKLKNLEEELQKLKRAQIALQMQSPTPPVEEAEAEWANARQALEEATQEKIDLQHAIDADQNERRDLGKEIVPEVSSLRHAQDLLAAIDAELAEVRKTQISLERAHEKYQRLNELDEEWRSIYPGDISPSRDLAASLNDELKRIVGMLEKLSHSKQGWLGSIDIYLKNDKRREVYERLTELVGGAKQDEASIIADAEKKLGEYQAAQSRLEKARDIAGNLSQRIGKVGDDAREAVTEGAFQENLNAHLLALSPHRNLNVDLRQFTKRGGGKGVDLQDRDLDIKDSYSEGELAAVSLSALLSSARTFRWSRWPALILDDPIQHEDAIHQAAFADAVRSLIKFSGYQVFISTHDRAKAEYLMRKMRSFDVRPELYLFRKDGAQHWIEPPPSMVGQAAPGVVQEG